MPKPIPQALKDQIAKSIRYLIEKKGIKVYSLANAVDVTPEAISRIITGVAAPGHETLIKIADYFDVSIDFIYGREERR